MGLSPLVVGVLQDWERSRAIKGVCLLMRAKRDVADEVAQIPTLLDALSVRALCIALHCDVENGLVKVVRVVVVEKAGRFIQRP